MTCENESGRQEEPVLKNGEVMGAVLQEAPKCGMCGGPIGSGPQLHYVRKDSRTLDGMRVCAVCFLKIIAEAGA